MPINNTNPILSARMTRRHDFHAGFADLAIPDRVASEEATNTMEKAAIETL